MTQNVEPRSQAAAQDWLMLETTKHQSGRGLAHLSRSLQQERKLNKRSTRIGGLRDAAQSLLFARNHPDGVDQPGEIAQQRQQNIEPEL